MAATMNVWDMTPLLLDGGFAVGGVAVGAEGEGAGGGYSAPGTSRTAARP